MSHEDREQKAQKPIGPLQHWLLANNFKDLLKFVTPIGEDNENNRGFPLNVISKWRG